jgi:hypothetical protein
MNELKELGKKYAAYSVRVTTGTGNKHRYIRTDFKKMESEVERITRLSKNDEGSSFEVEMLHEDDLYDLFSAESALWQITKDHINNTGKNPEIDQLIDLPTYGIGEGEKPKNNFNKNRSKLEAFNKLPKWKFRLYDDDDNLYYSGESTCSCSFAPLDWAMWDSGCTYIKYFDKKSRRWEIL